MRRLTLLTASSVLLLSGCAKDSTAADGGEGGETTETDTAGETSGGSGEVDPPEFEPILARGIQISAVEANQGVAIPIANGGTWVDGASRNAELIKNRNTLIRAFWQRDPDFQNREIEGRLTLTFEDGTTEVASKTFLIEGESAENNLDGSFWWMLPAEFVSPGLKFQVELYETGLGFEDTPEPDPAPVSPAEPGFMGIEASNQVLRVTLVPVEHDIGDSCPDAPVIDEFALEIFEEAIFQQNPAEEVVLTVREPVQFTSALTSFIPLLTFLADLRDTDGADPAEYYYGLVRPCDGGADGVGGQALDVPDFPREANGFSRVSMGRWYQGGTANTAETFVHEIGHNQGRRHVACSGEEGGPDPSYPYENGALGTWGFGVLDWGLHSATSGRDYMTYCGNTWVSDWTWHKVFPFIQEITSWGAGQNIVEEPDVGRLMVGLIDPATGTESWFETTGTVSGRSLSLAQTIEVEVDGQVTSLPATLGSMGDGDAYNVMVPLPTAIDLPQAKMTYVDGTQRHAIRDVRTGGQTLQLRR